MLAGIYAEKHDSSKKYQTKSWINITFKQAQNEVKISMVKYIYIFVGRGYYPIHSGWCSIPQIFSD